MLSIFNKRSRNLLGIDISSSSIKLLELSKQGDKYRVEHYATRPLPVGAVVEKNIANVEAVGEEILKLSTLVKTKTTDAAVAVSGASVIAKTPLLGDLPYVGNLFKKREENKSKTELLIFITPSVINELK